jgi:hypothetical protein
MISVQFYCVHMVTKQKQYSQPLFYNEMNDHVQNNIDVNMNRLRVNLNGFRVVCLITNVDHDTIKLTPS